MKGLKKAFTFLLDLLMVVFILSLTLYLVSIVNAKNNKYSVPKIGSISFLAVESGSMAPFIRVGDMVIINNSKVDGLKTGDIITYMDNGGNLITHRIVGLKDGLYITKGDANQVEDTSPVNKSSIVGRYGFKIPYGGYVMTFAKTKLGIVVCLILPSFIVFVYSFVMLLDEILNSRRHRKKIQRKRKRRRERYIKEGLFTDKRAAM